MKVRVPGTSANLGPGFDSLGLALTIYNEVEFTRSSEGSSIIDPNYSGSVEDHLIYKSYTQVFDSLKADLIPVQIKVMADIPQARGLGSSSACIVAGVVGAFHILGKELDQDEILYHANKIEGHPDNVAPCIKGGLVVSTLAGDEICSIKLPIKKDYKFLALIPAFKLSTQKARSVLPEKISLKDGIFNSSRVALLLAALATGNDAALRLGFEDRFHQPYRGPLIADFDEIMAFLKSKDILGAYLSGAGPTIMALTKKDPGNVVKEIQTFLKTLDYSWDLVELDLDDQGFVVSE